MKKETLLILFFGVLVSCKKDNSSSNTNTNCPPAPLATIKFKNNSTIIECNGSLVENSKEGALIRKKQKDPSFGTILTNTNYQYSIIATKNYFHGDDGEAVIQIEINTPTLTTSTYSQANNGINFTYVSLPTMSSNDGYPPESNFSLTVTKIVNGYADGTFSGKLKKEGFNVTGYDLITEGEFKNIRILE